MGTVFGKLIEDPAAIGVDVLLPFYFLGLVLAFRQRANWLPVVIVSGLAALAVQATVGTPWHIAGGALFGVVFAALRGKPSANSEPAAEVRHVD